MDIDESFEEHVVIDYKDELTTLVKSAINDIIYDAVVRDGVKVTIQTKELEILDVDIDDDLVFGTYKLIVNGGEIVITVVASGWCKWEQDNWDSSSESHYTTSGYCDDLQDFCYAVKKIEGLGGRDLDRLVDNDIDAAKEAHDDH